MLAILSFLCFFVFGLSFTLIFISPEFQDCVANKCNGSLSNPYDSFSWALYDLNNTGYINLEQQFYFIFMGNNSPPHYIMSQEIRGDNSNYYNFNTTFATFFDENEDHTKILMSPFYCDIFSNEIYNTSCVNRSDVPYIDVYLKTCFQS